MVFFSVSVGLFNFYSLHATVISWCTPFLEAAWKFTLEFPRLMLPNYCLVFLFRFSLPLNSVTSSAIYFIVTNNSSFQLIQTGNVSVIMSLPRELVLMFSELIFACIKLFLPHYVFRIHFHSCKYIYIYSGTLHIQP